MAGMVNGTIQTRLERVQQRIDEALRRAGRSHPVAVVGVTKTFPAGVLREAYESGLRRFGENRVQEFEAKRAELDLPGARFHLIGHLQSNKARRAVELFDCIDSVDSASLARRLDREAQQSGKVVPVLIQVRLGGEGTKHGIEPEAVAELLKEVGGLGGLRVEGLMTIPPYADDPEQSRPWFKQLRELAAKLNGKGFKGINLQRLSMGMSHDFEVAVEEGATEVRLGTVLFGEREGR